MLGKHNILGEDKPDPFYKTNDDIEPNEEKNPIDTQTNQTKESWNKFNEQSITRWHPSELEGYLSDEFRNIEFAD